MMAERERPPPKGWTNCAIGSLAEESTKRAGIGNDFSVLSVTKHKGIVPASEYFRKTVHGRDTSKYKVVRPGQFAYATIHLNEGSIGILGGETEGIVSPMYTVFDVNNRIDSEYFLSVLRSKKALEVYKRITQGTVNRRGGISFRMLSRLQVHLPPLGEQRKITAILSSVDGAIAKSQAVIDQLLVVKRGLMQALLTRGLPGRHTQFKQTEIGEVPEDWQVCPLRLFIQDGPNNGLYRPQNEYGAGTPILRIDNFENGERLRRPELRRVMLGDGEAERFAVKPGDILINRVNSLSHLGKCAMVVSCDETTVFESNMMRFSLDESRITSEFGFLWLSSKYVKHHLARKAKRAVAQASINQKDVVTIPTPCPSRSEQNKIAEIVRSVDRRLEAEEERLVGLRQTKLSLSSVLMAGEVRVNPHTEAA